MIPRYWLVARPIYVASKVSPFYRPVSKFFLAAAPGAPATAQRWQCVISQWTYRDNSKIPGIRTLSLSLSSSLSVCGANKISPRVATPHGLSALDHAASEWLVRSDDSTRSEKFQVVKSSRERSLFFKRARVPFQSTLAQIGEGFSIFRRNCCLFLSTLIIYTIHI